MNGCSIGKHQSNIVAATTLCQITMILGCVSFLDCFVFLIFLAPQLVIQVGFFSTLVCGLQALPFLVIKLPVAFIRDRVFTPRRYQSPFVQRASFFQDLVIRCVRYAFANIPARIGRVFFCKAVALPFLRFRMLRHGYLWSPIRWREVSRGNLQGLWIISDEINDPDVVIYYAHGGGFAMGSSYFYLEFLLVWLTLLKAVGFRNPAIFSVEYTLVPDKCYPTQLQQTVAGYKYALSMAGTSSRVCVAGDSAGASLILSLILHLGRVQDEIYRHVTPAMVVLISPWVTLISPKHQNTASDFLDTDTLHYYAHQYVGITQSPEDPLISPGHCEDIMLWKKCSPDGGFLILFGSEEVFAPEIRDLANILCVAGVQVDIVEEDGGIHAWPVAAVFLSETKEDRLKGLKAIAVSIRERMKL